MDKNMKNLVVLLFALLFMSCCEKDNVQVTKSGEKYNVTIKNKDGKVIFQEKYGVRPPFSTYCFPAFLGGRGSNLYVRRESSLALASDLPTERVLWQAGSLAWTKVSHRGK